MAAQNQKPSVLVLGLKHAPPNAPFNDAELWKHIQGELESLREAGYHADEALIEDPANLDVESLRKRFQSRAWTAVSIGYGVRGPPHYTALFERLVNLVIEDVQPTPKFLFQDKPNGIVEAVQRVFGNNVA